MPARWAPALLLGVGTLFTVGVDTQRSMPLRAPLGDAVPARLEGLDAKEIPLSEDQQRLVGVSDHLVRAYGAAFSLYVGYYDRQTQRQTIHSPKNCLPGAGWEALASSTARIETAQGPVTVNRYLIRKGAQQALVLYWYQGRGRVEANEYRVKWDLLRDAALRRRTEEALVRIVVPVDATEDQALAVGARVVRDVVPALARALPS